MSQPQFSPQPLLDFVAEHVKDDAMAGAAKEAVLPVLSGLAARQFVLEPIQAADLETVRAALQTMLGFTVREVRPLPFDEMLSRKSGESDRDYAGRMSEAATIFEENLESIETVIDCFDGFSEVYVDVEVDDALCEAYERSFTEPVVRDESPRQKMIAGMARTIISIQMPMLLAAAYGDRMVFARCAPLLPWLSRFIPIGYSIDELGVFFILTASAPL